MWLRKAEPKFTSTLRLHLAEDGEEEPFATGSSAEQVTVPPHIPATAIGQSFPSGKEAITVLADTRLPANSQADACPSANAGQLRQHASFQRRRGSPPPARLSKDLLIQWNHPKAVISDHAFVAHRTLSRDATTNPASTNSKTRTRSPMHIVLVQAPREAISRATDGRPARTRRAARRQRCSTGCQPITATGVTEAERGLYPAER